MKKAVAPFIVMILVTLSIGANPMLAGAADEPARARGGGWLDRVKFSNANGTYTVTSTTPVPLYRMNVNFTNVYAGPVMVTFSACTAVASVGETLMVSAQIDGVGMAPFEIGFEASASGGARSYTWAAGNIPPGYHVVRIVARTYNGTAAYITQPTLTVLHTQ